MPGVSSPPVVSSTTPPCLRRSDRTSTPVRISAPAAAAARPTASTNPIGSQCASPSWKTAPAIPSPSAGSSSRASAAESTSPPAGRAAKPAAVSYTLSVPRRSNPSPSPSAASSAWRARLASLSARIARVPAAAREAREETTNRPSHGSTAGRGRSEKGLSGFSSQRSPSRSAAGFAIGDEWLGQISPAFPAEHPAASAGPRSSSVTLAPRRASS